MKFLKSVSRISKRKINLLFKVFNSDVRVNETVIKSDKLYELCSDKFDLIDYSEKEYSFDYSFNGISTDRFSLSLSKSMIKLFLFLHFLPSNKSGVRKNISYSGLAKSLNVSVTTIRSNMDRLSKLNFIWITKADRGMYDIVIVDEYKNHETTEGGYITMPLNMLYHLLSFENVNELKVELKKILWCDAKVNFNEANVSFNKDNLLKVLPDYVRPYKKNEILNSSKSMFKFENGTLNYNTYKTKEEILSPLYLDYKSVIEGFFVMSKMEYSKYHMDNKHNALEFNMLESTKALILDDLIGLAIQYNINLVLRALQDLYMNYGGEGKNEVINTPAFVRSRIEHYIIYDKISA